MLYADPANGTWRAYGNLLSCITSYRIIPSVSLLLVLKISDAEVMITVRVLCSRVEQLKWRHKVCIKQR